MKSRTRQIGAAAISVVMSVTGILPHMTAVASAEEAVSFPAAYTADLVIPEDDEDVVNEKVEALVKTMTAEEKFSFLGGSGTGMEGNAGALPGVPRLGVPEVKMYDGPAGLLYTEDTTNPPQEQMLAATWDEEMARLYGEVVSEENKEIGGGMMLSAQLDIQRVPQFGRTKDQMGEDPYLLSSLADDLTEGMQSQGGIAVLKHFAAFAQNANPGSNTNVEVSEQALHEIYLPGFESAVKDGNALGIMSSYNKLHGTFASANTYLLQDVLRDMWKYRYYTITDWGGNDGYTLNKGTEIEMPMLSNNSQESIAQLVTDGSLTQEEADAQVDEALTRILRAYGHAGYLTLVEVDENGMAKEEAGRTDVIKVASDPDALKAQHAKSDAAVQKIAEEGAVLLKNENETLPLDTKEGKKVAVIGITGLNLASGIGGERSYGTIASMTSPYEALTDLLGNETVQGAVYEDIIGEVIPAESLFTSADGDENGVLRTYGTAGSEGTPIVMQGQTFYMGAVDPVEMEGHEMGEAAATDELISFTTGTIDGKPNKTYVNSDDGTAFPAGEHCAYTWETYLEAGEDGEYALIYESMGGSGNMKVYDTDGETELGKVSGPTANQGTMYYSSIVPTETGMNVAAVQVSLKAGERYRIVITSAQNVSNKDMQVQLAWITPSMKEENKANALKAAQECDTVVVFAYAKVSDPGMEQSQTSLKLDESQEKMILSVAEAAHEAGNKVAVVLNNDSAVVMENWIEEADAILEMYYPGQRGGAATANLLTGKVNPSGKLAFTIPKRDEETILTCSEQAWTDWLTEDEGGNTTTFSEGIMTGYRWYDENGIEPEFDFGYGLSYTTFEYSDLEVKAAASDGEQVGYDVTFTVTNTGEVTGSEVAQVYLGEAQVPEGIQSAKVQLAGFEKIKDLEPGSSREVTIHVNERSLSYWNANQDDLTEREDGTKDKWTLAQGSRTIYVGSASDQLMLSAEADVQP
ncbi:MAG: glycoside hydrolase family 3 C-terminal domain-containing protein [Blautia sp.]|nr:glycoside hydrolase family 3 C-terminal domain-containing protein [Blautia sp.]